MTKIKFQEMLIFLAENYGQAMTESRVKAMTYFVEYSIGFDHDWLQIGSDIALKERFFPNVAVIADYVQSKSVEFMSSKEKATKCVDRYIAYLNGIIPREDISEQDMEYAKKNYFVDKYSYQRNNINLDFKRKEWIEITAMNFDQDKRDGVESNKIEAPSHPKIVNFLEQNDLKKAIKKEKK